MNAAPDEPTRLPRFSVITVCLNDLAGLEETALGIAGQTYRQMEWLVVDGGSTDGTVEWLRSHPLARWTSEADKGLYDAMNKGIERAQGDYLLFMNAGDTFAGGNVLADLAALLQRAEVPIDFVYGDSIDVLDSSQDFYRAARPHTTLWLGMFAQHQAMVFRRDRIEGDVYNLRYELSGDYAFVARFLRKSPEPVVSRVGWPICRFQLGGLSTSRRRAALSEDYRIRRNVIGIPAIGAQALMGAHWLHYLLKTRLPSVFRALRYRRGERSR